MDIDFQFADTHGSRMNFIVSELGMDYPILDIGCGELKYYRRFMRRNYNYQHPYFATDTDPEVAAHVTILKERMEADNLYFFTSWDDFQYKEPVNIILTEVIEHNTPADAVALVKKCLSLNFHKLVITTPDSRFNSYYFEAGEEQLRHEDHHFEWTDTEFQSFIKECVGAQPFAYTFYGIGDKINGVTPTQAVVITRK